MSNTTSKSTSNLQYSVSTPQLPTSKSPTNVQFPLPLQHNATHAAVISQIESDDDLELEESSDKHKNLHMNGNLSTKQRKGKEN
jgi:hypothetical protein